MKKVLVILATVLFIFLLVSPAIGAFAEEAAGTTEDAGAYTWAYLLTSAGATAVVLLIVQYTKALVDKIVHIPTQIYAYVLALGIMLAARAFTVGLTASSVVLVAINAVGVATAAMIGYELTFKKSETK